MKVKFRSTFIVPGFGRSRFQAGICLDVPEALRTVLPSTAEILPDDFIDGEDHEANEKDAADKYSKEQAAAKKTAEVMNASGMDGWADETDSTVGPQLTPESDAEEPIEDKWEFDGQVYKTEPAMKAAITRAKKKIS
jgi:hypothetical protein